MRQQTAVAQLTRWGEFVNGAHGDSEAEYARGLRVAERVSQLSHGHREVLAKAYGAGPSAWFPEPPPERKPHRATGKRPGRPSKHAPKTAWEHIAYQVAELYGTGMGVAEGVRLLDAAELAYANYTAQDR